MHIHAALQQSSSTLLEKLKMLLTNPEEEATPSSIIAFEQERRLVAWVLLTR
jgi:hypothetical protein